LKKTDIEIFELLKQRVALTFLKENTALSTDITQWKGDDIIKFQEDLLDKVKGRVSEKWFYNYFRNDIQKLPRIDMLNLLSEYVEAKDWASFKTKHATQKKSIIKKYALLVLVPLSYFLVMWLTSNTHQVQLCFVDENNKPITEMLQVKVYAAENTSEIMHTSQANCISFYTKEAQVKIHVKAAYFKEKIFTRALKKTNYSERVSLETNLYSLMLRHYSNSNTTDWKLRKTKLDQIIAPDALIYQRWFGADKGVELYSKEDFILQLTVPTSMLRNLEIIETQFEDGRIIKLGFKVNR